MGRANANSDEIRTITKEEYAKASEAMRSSTSNVTEGRKSIKAGKKATKKLPDLIIPDPSEIGEYAPFENNDIKRRDGLTIKRHDYTPSDGSDIIANKEGMTPGEIESVHAIKRMIDDLRVVWIPGDLGGKARIKEFEAGEERDDERLGYALCTLDGDIALRVWRQANTAVRGFPRWNPDGSPLIRAGYVRFTKENLNQIRDCLQQICARRIRELNDGKGFSIPKFEKSALQAVIDDVADDNGPVNRALEIAETTDWDGTPRMINFLKDLGYTVSESCGLTPQKIDYWLECCSYWTFMGLMERQIRTTVYDLYLMFWGDQGLGKTTTAQFIGNGYCSEALQIPREKDTTTQREFLRATKGMTVCSMEEGDQFTKNNVNFLKSLVSLDRSRITEKYQTTVEERPIKCIFTVTTNEQQIIKDPDGRTRRYLPVKAGRTREGLAPIDVINDIEANHPEYMDQIYAEALFRVREKLAENDKQRAWSSGEKLPDGTVLWAFDESMYAEGGLQAMVCRECLEKDARVEDLADYVKARLTGEIVGGDAPIETVGGSVTVEATAIEADYYQSAKPGQIGRDWAGMTKTLRKNAGLYGLDYRVIKIGGRAVRGYRLQESPPSTAEAPHDIGGSPPSSKEAGI